MRIVLTILGGIAAFCLVFVGALHLHFPSDAARDRLAWELQEATGGDWMLQATSASPYRLTGLALEDATLYSVERPRGRRGADKEPVAVPVLRVDSLAARLQVLSLLGDLPSASYRAELYDGSLSGELGFGQTRQRLVVKGRDLDLSRIPLEGEEWSIDATGMVRIDGDIDLDLEEIKQSKGHLELELTDLVFQAATIMGMTLEPTAFTESILVFEIDDGRAEVQKGRFTSEPVDITVDGEIVLNRNLARSRLKLELEVRFNDSFDKLAQMAPNLKSARDESGAYHFRVTGTLDNPRAREERQSRRTPMSTGSRTRIGNTPDDGPDVLDAPDDEDAEARRKARRDRIRERRKNMLDRRGTNRDEPGGLPATIDPNRDLPDEARMIDRSGFEDDEVYDQDELDGPDDFLDGEDLPDDLDMDGQDLDLDPQDIDEY